MYGIATYECIRDAEAFV